MQPYHNPTIQNTRTRSPRRYSGPATLMLGLLPLIAACGGSSEDPGGLPVQVEGQDATVTYDPDKTNPEKIAEAIRRGGDTVLPDG